MAEIAEELGVDVVINGGEHTGTRPGRALRGRGFRPAGPVSDGTGVH